MNESGAKSHSPPKIITNGLSTAVPEQLTFTTSVYHFSTNLNHHLNLPDKSAKLLRVKTFYRQLSH